MKKIFLTTCIFLLFGLIIVQAQDTMYIHQKTGGIIKIAVNNIDYVIFYSSSSIVNPVQMANCGIVEDVDGNVYNTVTIGNQCWLQKNLNVTHFNNCNAIPLVTDKTAWENETAPAYCNYNNTTNADTINTYGRLYNWYTVNTGNLCPTGWHVPSDGEWNILEKYLDGTVDTAADDWVGINIGDKLKEAGTSNWLSGNIGTNSSGFKALPGGYRFSYGSFYSIGYMGYWWCSSDFNTDIAWSRILFYNLSNIGSFYISKQLGFSVRCISD